MYSLADQLDLRLFQYLERLDDLKALSSTEISPARPDGKKKRNIKATPSVKPEPLAFSFNTASLYKKARVKREVIEEGQHLAMRDLSLEPPASPQKRELHLHLQSTTIEDDALGSPTLSAGGDITLKVELQACAKGLMREVYRVSD